MKLRNKKTGEIIEAESCNNTGGYISIYYEEKDGQIGTKDCYTSLAELNEEWEDYEEHYFITEYGGVYAFNEYDGVNNVANVDDYKQIGNYFKTKEQAEKSVEALKTWKQLKEKGFQFINFTLENNGREGLIHYMCEQPCGKKELTKVFGVEE